MKMIVLLLLIYSGSVFSDVPLLLNEPVYTGNQMSLDYDNISVRDVITTLADFSGLNIVSSEDVTGNISLKLHDVRWDEVLDYVLTTKGLEKYESGNVIWIFPAGQLQKFRIQKKELALSLENSDDLFTDYIKINYGRAEDFRNLLRGTDSRAIGGCGLSSQNTASMASAASVPVQSGQISQTNLNGQVNTEKPSNLLTQEHERFLLISARGSVVVESRTNTLIVRETKKRIDEIKALIFRLDVPVRQVVVESRIVIANSSFAKSLGVRFGVTNTAAVPGGPVVDNAVAALALSNPYGQLGLVLAKSANFALSTEFTALQNSGGGHVLSNPRIMTSDRCQAKIKQGYQVPYQSSSGLGGTNIQFKEAVLELDVMPQITPNGGITMNLVITKNEIDASNSVNGQPSLIERSISTIVHVRDGETLVLGGVNENTDSSLKNAVPWFTDIPVLGWLFTRRSDNDAQQELTVFITPKIINL